MKADGVESLSARLSLRSSGVPRAPGERGDILQAPPTRHSPDGERCAWFAWPLLESGTSKRQPERLPGGSAVFGVAGPRLTARLWALVSRGAESPSSCSRRCQESRRHPHPPPSSGARRPRFSRSVGEAHTRSRCQKKAASSVSGARGQGQRAAGPADTVLGPTPRFPSRGLDGGLGAQVFPVAAPWQAMGEMPRPPGAKGGEALSSMGPEVASCPLGRR